MIALGASDIGGGIVRRRFTIGDRDVVFGDRLTAADILAIPLSNRRALVERGHLSVYPPSGQAADPADRHIANLGFGKFDVIEGRKLNSSPLTKDEAEALVAQGDALKN